jgi:hypothetical protein
MVTTSFLAFMGSMLWMIMAKLTNYKIDKIICVVTAVAHAVGAAFIMLIGG